MRSKNRLRFFLFYGFPVIVSLLLLMNMPANDMNAIVFGMSRSRLLVAGLLLMLSVIFSILTIRTTIYSGNIVDWHNNLLKSPKILSLTTITSGVFIFLSGAFVSIPNQYLGTFWAIGERLYPLAIWVLISSSQLFLGLIGWQISNKNYVFSKIKVINTIRIFLVLISIWLFIALTGLGLNSLNTFWSKAGVPLLWGQIFFSIGITFILSVAIENLKIPTSRIFFLDISLILVIWLTATILWHNQAYEQGVFNTPPQKPTYEIFPINDSYIYDTAAQKILIGQNIPAEVNDKPLFISFLALLHFFAGSSYTTFYFYMGAFLAAIPLCGFAIGKIIHSRFLGILFSIILIFKEFNSIALTNYIHVSNSKMILSEMLTTLGVLLFTIFFAKWLKFHKNGEANLWIAGGILGLTSLVRLNSIGILASSIILIGLAVNFKWKKWITASIILIVFVLISAAPWMLRNFTKSGNPFNFIENKTNGVILNQRYEPILSNHQSAQSSVTKYKELGQKIITSYLHNLVGITLMLPPTLISYDLLDLVRLQYWKLDWNGNLQPDGFVIVLLVLCIIALGIASSWTRWRTAGLAPLGVVLGYDITIAISLTSGGRYLTPIDWGGLLYFSIGIYEITIWLASLFDYRKPSDIGYKFFPTDQINNRLAPLIIGILFFILGGIPILLETIKADVYSTVNMNDFIIANAAIPEFSKSIISHEFDTLSENPLIMVIHGKTLFPRTFKQNKGISPDIADDPLIGKADYDRLTFLLIGGEKDEPVIFPTEQEFSFNISGADTWLVGCKRSNYIEAIGLVFRWEDSFSAHFQKSMTDQCR